MFKRKVKQKTKLTKEQIRDWIVENCKTTFGYIDLSELDFSKYGCDVFISGMTVSGNLYQDHQKVLGSLHQSRQYVGGDLIQSRSEVSGKLFQGSHRLSGNLYQSDQNVGGSLYQDKCKVGESIKQHHQTAGKHIIQNGQTAGGKYILQDTDELVKIEDAISAYINKPKEITTAELLECGYVLKEEK